MPRSSNPYGRSESSLIEELMRVGLLGGAGSGIGMATSGEARASDAPGQAGQGDAPQQPLPPLDPDQGAPLPRMPLADVARAPSDAGQPALPPLMEKGLGAIGKATGLQDYLATQRTDLLGSFDPWMSALFGSGANDVFSDFGGLDAPPGK